MALEPITRQEKIIAGQDLTPITRMEKFLKQFGGGGGGGGAQPDLSQTDTAKPDYVKGVIRQESLPDGYPYKEISLIIEWDGNTEGLASISGIFYKVSDVIPDNETLKNCFIEFYNKNTGVYSKVSVADKWDYMVSKGYVTENYVALEELGVVVKSPTDAMPETGIYFMGSSASYTSKLYTETIHPMAREFLPELTSPNGTKYKLTVADDGTLSAVQV